MQLLTLRHGDCVARMAEMPEGNIDAIVCDPPYGLEFQGKAWDAPWKEEEGGTGWRTNAGMSKVGLGGRGIPWPSFAGGDSANATCATCGGRMRGAKKCACETPEWRVKGKPLDQTHTKTAQMQAFGKWSESWLREAYRVLKPGGVLMAFGGTRTHHRLSAAMKAVGFTDLSVRAWSYATGFPKSLDVSKAMDKAQGSDTETEAAVSAYLKERRKALGFSSSAVDMAVFGGTTRYSWVEGRKDRTYLPTPEEWLKLKDFLGLDNRFDAYIRVAIPSREMRMRLDGGKGHLEAEAEGNFGYQGTGDRWNKTRRIVKPKSEQAQQWQGYGTALRPSWEPVVCGRKPA